MHILRVVLTPGFLALIVLASYVFFRLVPGARTEVFWIVGMTTFGALELITLGILALKRHTSRALLLVHALNAAGALLMAYSGLLEDAVVLFASGSVVFVAGMLLWQRELREQNSP